MAAALAVEVVAAGVGAAGALAAAALAGVAVGSAATRVVRAAKATLAARNMLA